MSNAGYLLAFLASGHQKVHGEGRVGPETEELDLTAKVSVCKRKKRCWLSKISHLRRSNKEETRELATDRYNK